MLKELTMKYKKSNKNKSLLDVLQNETENEIILLVDEDEEDIQNYINVLMRVLATKEDNFLFYGMDSIQYSANVLDFEKYKILSPMVNNISELYSQYKEDVSKIEKTKLAYIGFNNSCLNMIKKCKVNSTTGILDNAYDDFCREIERLLTEKYYTKIKYYINGIHTVMQYMEYASEIEK